jgi:hypothetical protein
MQIKTTMRCHLSPTRRATTKTSKNQKISVREYALKLEPAAMENRMVVPQKLELELPYDLAIPLLGIISRTELRIFA